MDDTGRKCFHIWTMAMSGNGMFRLKRCFKSRSAARTVANRGVTGDRGGRYVNHLAHNMVLQCQPGCPCGPKRMECQHDKGDCK